MVFGAPPPPPPPLQIDEHLSGELGDRKCKSSIDNEDALNPGQIQFLKKFRDAPLSEEMIDYYSGIDYYRQLVGGDVGGFIQYLAREGYIQHQDLPGEGLICTEKGREITDRLVIGARSGVEDLLEFVKPLWVSEALKVATELKRDGNLSAAVVALKEAYKKASTSDDGCGIDAYLRLPSYLQKMGRYDEAWGFLNRLLLEGYPGQTENLPLRIADQTKIYKAMCRLLRNEGKRRQSIVFGVASLVSGLQCCYLQSKERDQPEDFREQRAERFRSQSQADNIRNEIKRIAGKEAGEELLEAVTRFLCGLLNQPAAIKYDRLIVEVDKMVWARNRLGC